MTASAVEPRAPPQAITLRKSARRASGVVRQILDTRGLSEILEIQDPCYLYRLPTGWPPDCLPPKKLATPPILHSAEKLFKVWRETERQEVVSSVCLQSLQIAKSLESLTPPTSSKPLEAVDFAKSLEFLEFLKSLESQNRHSSHFLPGWQPAENGLPKYLPLLLWRPSAGNRVDERREAAGRKVESPEPLRSQAPLKSPESLRSQNPLRATTPRNAGRPTTPCRTTWRLPPFRPPHASGGIPSPPGIPGSQTLVYGRRRDPQNPWSPGNARNTPRPRPRPHVTP